MDCFDRDRESKTLWKHFKAGRNVLMLAPRRTGKTVLLDRLRTECDAQAFHGLVLDVEGFSEEKDFFRQLSAAIQEEIGIGRSLLTAVTGRLKQIVTGSEVGTGEDWRNLLLQVDWTVFAEHLLAQLQEDKRPDNRDWLFLVDEITIFVQALLNRHGKDRASDFLYALRRLTRAYPRIKWLFTGSIGLDIVARRQGFEGALVDLEIFPLEPFDRTTATAFVQHMASQNSCSFGEDAIEALLDRLGWFSPYYLTKFAESACDKAGSGVVGKSQIDAAAEDLLSVARRTYWSTWREHLDKNFLEPERSRLFQLLATASRSPDGASIDTLLLSLYSGDGSVGDGSIVGEGELRNLLDTLEADGYLSANAERSRFVFRMNLLREWWARYVAGPVGKSANG